MREITFELPGRPALSIRAVEQADGSLLFELSAISDKSVDLRALYFNLADPSLIGSLSATGTDLTDQAYSDVSDLNGGSNVKGVKSSYDVGLNFGTPGLGADEISATSFVLSSTNGEDLTLDLVAKMEFGARIQGERGGSQKISVIAPAAPDAIDDVATTEEDTPLTVDVVANDTDADGDSLSVVEVGAANHGTLQIVDNQIVYTPDENWSGVDNFSYRIFDGDGGYDTAMATIHVEAVADAPNLSLSTRAGNSVNEIIVDISSSLVDTDGSESYILAFSDLPDGVSIQGANGGEILLPTGEDSITLVLDEDQSFDFDFSVQAISTEASNNDSAMSSESIPVVYDHNEMTQNVDFEAIGQSIWTSGDEFVFTDNRFLGIDIADSGSNGGLISTDWSYDIKAGLQSDLRFEGGNIDAVIPWRLDFESSFNRTTDVLTLDTSAALLNGGSFQTDGPSLQYMLDFIFEYDVYANVNIYVDLGSIDLGSIDLGLVEIDFGEIDFGAINKNLFTINMVSNDDYESVNILDYDSDTADEWFYDFPFGITGSLAWPNLEVSGGESSLGMYSGYGESDNVLDINLDIDQCLAEIICKVLGSPVTVNPFDLGADVVIAGASLELLDLDVNAGLRFLQEFELQSGSLNAYLVFEDGSVSDTFNFGDELTFGSASALDDDNDGAVEFEIVMDLVDSSLHNDTDLGFNVGYNFDLVKGDWWYGVEIAGYDLGDDGSFGPLVDLGDDWTIASIDVFSTNVDVNFADQSIGIYV